MPKKVEPDIVIGHVAQRLLLGRKLAGMTQEQLGEALGVTFQQIQKYEWGQNRITASRLYDVAIILNVPVSFFYDELPGIPEQAVWLPNDVKLLKKIGKLSERSRRALEDIVDAMLH